MPTTRGNAAWAAMELFGTAVKAGGTGPVTSASILAGLYTLKDETLGGLAPPLTFVKGQANLHNCYFVIGITGGKFVAPNGITPSCAPDDVIATALKAFLSGG